MKKAIVLIAMVFAVLCLCSIAGAEDGWVKDGDYLYYYKNDAVLTGTQTVEGKVYVFANTGALKGNGQVQETEYGIVYPGTDNKLLTGWQSVAGKKYYFNPEDSRATTMNMAAGLGYEKPCIIDGVSYLFSDDGALVINGWWTRYGNVEPYFHSDDQGRVVFGYHKYGDHYYYFDDNGCSVEGFQLVDGKVHYFSGTSGSGEGFCEVRGWKKADKDWYYFSPSTGVMQTGKLSLDGYQYQFSENGKLVIDDITFIFDNLDYKAIGANGELLIGWQSINNNTYWFETNIYSEKYGAAVKGINWLYAPGEEERYYYYFNDEYQLQKNLLIKLPVEDEKEYYFYFGSDGKRKYGWQTISGNKYYFGNSFDNSGQAYTGPREITEDGEDETWYYFNDEGVLQTNSMIKHLNYWGDTEYYYYYGADGKRVTGWQTIDDKKYYFSPERVTGVNQIENAYYYFDEDGAMQANLLIKHVVDDEGNEKYFYYGSEGKRLYGWQVIDNNRYYFGNNGQAYTGPREINEDGENETWYYFNDEGILQTNLLIKHLDYWGDKEYYYYYGADGKRVTGWQTINGDKRYFIPEGCTGVTNIKDDVYYFDEEGVMQADLLIMLPDHWGTTDVLYYFGPDGKRASGWQTIKGKKYYFDTFYCSAYTNGAISFIEDGEEIIYYFNADGIMQTDSFIKHYDILIEKEAYFYYGPDGKRVTGWKTIKGDKYYFDKYKGAYTGTHTINDIIYTFSDEGKLLDTVVPVTGVSLNKSTLELKPGDSETLVSTVAPADATNKTVSWYCDDTNIAKVDANGKVTALGSGETAVWVRTEYGDFTAYCGISVAEVDPIEAFVTRCYQLILNREPDEGGLNGWSESLKSKTAAAAQIIDGFVRSDEFKNRNLSDGEKVDILYKTMLNRAADEGGKAGWVDALNQGYTLQNIIDGFCASDEFTALCKDFGIEPGTVNVNPVNPEPAPDTPRGKIEAFVKRCYRLILNRDADQGGLQGWSDALETGVGQACQIIDGFVRSSEYINRNLGYAESVDILYQTMLNRAADSAGRAGWVDALNQGYTLQHIINGFCGSEEFTNICNEFGITAGNLLVQGVIVKREAIAPEGEEEAPVIYVNYDSEYTNEEKIRAFVEHCYEAVFGREGDAEGVEAYMKLILDGRKTPKRVAYEFIFSAEFQNNLPGNEAFIRILYRLYFNRDADAEGLAGWVAMLENGTSLEDIVNGFASSAEFKAIVNGMRE